MVTIKQKLIPAGTNARSGYALKPEFLTIHNTGNVSKGSNAASHASYMSNSGKNTYVSYHYVVDDKEAYQLLPDNEVAWHAGDGNSGPGNRKSLAIEICENADGNLLKATDNAVELTAYLMKKHNIPLSNVVQHNKWSGKNCPNRIRAGQPYNWQTFLNKVQAAYAGTTSSTTTSGFQATELKSMTNAQVVAKVGPLFTADQQKTGVLASVSMAQFLLESAYGKSELAQNANNCFGMKKSLSGNTWAGSKWDGSSVYTKETKEQYSNGTYIDVNAEFRKYACIEDSIADHSAYLVGAKNGADLRYAGLKGETDYRKAAQIIKDGGYATALTYVDSLCDLIKKLDLTKYDVKTSSTSTSSGVQYRVRKSWADASSQLGAFANLENAKNACKDGYYVYDNSGNVVYPLMTSGFAVGDAVQLVSGATYTNGKAIPNWVVKSKLYVREIRSNGDIVFSTLKIGLVTGVAAAKYFKKYGEAAATFNSYKVKINTDALNVRKGPGVSYGVVTVVKRGEVYTIVEEKNGWGLLKSNAGWINLSYTKKV